MFDIPGIMMKYIPAFSFESTGSKVRGQVIYLPKMFRIDEKLEF